MSTLNYRPCIGWSAVILSVLILAAFCIPAVAADDTGGILMPGAKNFDLYPLRRADETFQVRGRRAQRTPHEHRSRRTYGQVPTTDENQLDHEGI